VRNAEPPRHAKHVGFGRGVHDAHLPRARATRSARYGTRRGRWDRLSSLRASHSTQKKKKGKKEKRKNEKNEKLKMRKKEREKGLGFVDCS
jgi:hypothetical protein